MILDDILNDVIGIKLDKKQKRNRKVSFLFGNAIDRKLKWEFIMKSIFRMKEECINNIDFY